MSLSVVGMMGEGLIRRSLHKGQMEHLLQLSDYGTVDLTTVLVPNDRGGDSLLSTDNAVRQGAINAIMLHHQL